MRNITRRDCLKLAGLAAGSAALGSTQPAQSNEVFPGYPERFGALVDLTLCVGCRKCEFACNKANKLPNAPLETFEDKAVFERPRRPNADAFTVVNRYRNPLSGEPVYKKVQCMHCEEPACASACLVGAFKKTPEGAVTYNEDVCIGCRYCMVACPFNIPAYEYEDPISPAVRKCTFCFSRISKENGVPACVEICPEEAIAFGKRSDLIALAHERIVSRPGRYVDHVYGEHEAGGTSWMYLSPVPFEELGFPTGLGTTPYPEYTRGFLSAVPVVLIMWPALLMGCYALVKHKEKNVSEAASDEKTAPAGAGAP